LALVKTSARASRPASALGRGAASALDREAGLQAPAEDSSQEGSADAVAEAMQRRFHSKKRRFRVFYGYSRSSAKLHTKRIRKIWIK
jgi:hypothetical protein